MTQPRKITVGVDAETPSRLAVDWTIELAAREPVHVTLLTAFDMILTDPLHDETRLEAERQRIFATVPNAVVDIAEADGSIPKTLLRYAEQSDLLVIGAHRTRHWQSVLTGDLPARMARSSSCAIVIVPDDWEPRQGAVVVGLDDDASSDSALAWAAEFAASTERELHILHAWMRPIPPADPVTLYVHVPVELQASHRERLDSATRQVRGRHPKLRVREDLYEGGSDSGLLAAAASAGLIVVGSHRRGPISGLVHGSTASELIQHSRTPICVAPPRREIPHGEPANFEEAWA